MKTTTERIFKSDTDLMYWQHGNCCRCTKAVLNGGKYRCVLQRDAEKQISGELEINRRSYDILHNIKECPLIKSENAHTEEIIAPSEFAKGESIIKERPVEVHTTEKSYKPTEAEINEAESKVINSIWEQTISPALTNNITPISNTAFKKKIHISTQKMLQTFTWQENMQIAFVPLIISSIAWKYAFKVLDYCTKRKIIEFKKVTREVKQIREDYVGSLTKDLDLRHIYHIDSQTDKFINEISYNMTVLFFQCKSYLMLATSELSYEEMRAYAMMVILLVRYEVAHNEKMDAIISSKIGESHGETNPYMLKLAKVMHYYLPDDVKIGTNNNLEMCAKIFENTLSKVEFDLKD